MANLMLPYQLEGKGAWGRCVPPPRSIRSLGVQEPGARFSAAAASLPRTPTRRASCSHTGGPRLATPTRPLQSSCRSAQWRSYEWHDLPELGSRQSHRVWTPGKILLEGEAGRGCCIHANLPVSLESPNHSAANWLRDVAGCRFPMGLCGTLLPSD
uniref:Uncharacterized protein n=1 Tax=Equus asinus TaxID=9793 RepID=A0A9L0JSC0_EQUAS